MKGRNVCTPAFTCVSYVACDSVSLNQQASWPPLCGRWMGQSLRDPRSSVMLYYIILYYVILCYIILYIYIYIYIYIFAHIFIGPGPRGLTHGVCPYMSSVELVGAIVALAANHQYEQTSIQHQISVEMITVFMMRP